METGQWLVGPDGVRWHFDAGSLCLDFGYTGSFGWDVIEWERLNGAADLTDWLRHHVHGAVREASSADLALALRLRDAIVAVARAFAFRSQASIEKLDIIDEFAMEPDIPPLLRGGPPAEGWAVSRALAAIARDAVALFSRGGSRFRVCSADDCYLIFYDTSRPGSRRWCSMQRCGNRRKMRERRTRTSVSSPYAFDSQIQILESTT